MNELIERRLSHHLLGGVRGSSIAETARHMMATQAQELWGGKLALSVRTAGSPTARDVDAAFDSGDIVRTWPQRGTLHIVAADDVQFALSVATDRVFRASATRHRELGLAEPDFQRAEAIARRVLSRGGLSRPEFWAALAADGVDSAGQRGYDVVLTLAMRGVVHWGATIPRDDGAPASQQLLQLNDDLPVQRAVPDDPASELLRRYLRAHAPALAEDFAWWSGLTLTRARAAAAAIADGVSTDEEGRMTLTDRPAGVVTIAAPRAHVLPSFDEYYLSYRDRTVACDPAYLKTIGPGANGMVHPLVLREGLVVATWTRAGEVRVLDPSFDEKPEGVLTPYREHAL